MKQILKQVLGVDIVQKELVVIFAYYLDGKGFLLSIVLPNKISNYMRTLDSKTVTDKTASQAICQFGLERKLDS
jgi:hypothetical protein